MADKNIDQSKRYIEKFTRKAIKSVTAADWKKEVNYVERFQKEYWEKDKTPGNSGKRIYYFSWRRNERSAEKCSDGGVGTPSEIDIMDCSQTLVESQEPRSILKWPAVSQQVPSKLNK